jgi:D-erythro-7,8-dihydroneopterin triphosphate epimerase
MDKLLIKDLRARCILGVGAEERRETQEVVVNIALMTDLHLPGRSDRFEDAVDYRAIKKQVLAAIENSQFRLVEALAQDIADICLEHSAVEEVQVTVEKPSALRFARSVGAEITRRRASMRAPE